MRVVHSPLKWVAGAFLAAILFAGCGAGGYNGPSGTVVGKGFSPSHYDPCASWAKVCFGGSVGDRWYLELQDDSDSGDTWASVSKQAYGTYKTGDHYPQTR